MQVDSSATTPSRQSELLVSKGWLQGVALVRSFSRRSLATDSG